MPIHSVFASRSKAHKSRHSLDRRSLTAFAQTQCVRRLQAGKLVGSIAKLCGGGGGGRPNLAQAGGRQPEKIPEALERARAAILDALETL